MQKGNLFFFIAIAIIIFPLSFAYANIEIKAEVDKQKLSTDELLTYKLTVLSAQKSTPAPQVPNFTGFNIISQAQSNTVSFAKSKFQNIIVYAFILSPKEAGKFKIEPSQIKLQGQTYQAEAFEIEVTAVEAKPALPGASPESPAQEKPEEEKPAITL